MQEMQVQSLGQEDALEKEMAIYSSILAWEIPWTVEPGRLQCMGSQRTRHGLATEQKQQQQSFILVWTGLLSSVCVLVSQSCLTHCDPMDCGPPGSSVRGILQARILE